MCQPKLRLLPKEAKALPFVFGWIPRMLEELLLVLLVSIKLLRMPVSESIEFNAAEKQNDFADEEFWRKVAHNLSLNYRIS